MKAHGMANGCEHLKNTWACRWKRERTLCLSPTPRGSKRVHQKVSPGFHKFACHARGDRGAPVLITFWWMRCARVHVPSFLNTVAYSARTLLNSGSWPNLCATATQRWVRKSCEQRDMHLNHTFWIGKQITQTPTPKNNTTMKKEKKSPLADLPRKKNIIIIMKIQNSKLRSPINYPATIHFF